MAWTPDKKQIDLIVDYAGARMGFVSIAKALDVEPEEFRVWGSRACGDACP